MSTSPRALTATQARVLRATTWPSGALTTTEIAAHLASSPAAVRRALVALNARGYTERAGVSLAGGATYRATDEGRAALTTT